MSGAHIRRCPGAAGIRVTQARVSWKVDNLILLSALKPSPHLDAARSAAKAALVEAGLQRAIDPNCLPAVLKSFGLEDA